MKLKATPVLREEMEIWVLKEELSNLREAK